MPYLVERHQLQGALWLSALFLQIPEYHLEHVLEAQFDERLLRGNIVVNVPPLPQFLEDELVVIVAVLNCFLSSSSRLLFRVLGDYDPIHVSGISKFSDLKLDQICSDLCL